MILLQLFYLSGILTVFFCGIVMSHYTWHNVTESSRITTKYVCLHAIHFLKFRLIKTFMLALCNLAQWHPTRHTFATLSFIAEIFIFLYVGMDALDIDKWRFISDSPGKSIGISSILLGLVMVGRAAFVFPLSFLSNLSKKFSYEKIDFKQQVCVLCVRWVYSF